MRTLKEKVWRADGNSMIVETGHKTFDRQTNVLGPGNIHADTLLGKSVRGEMILTCYGPKRHKPGWLRAFDLAVFGGSMPKHVWNYIVRRTRNKDRIWVYELFHYNGHKRIVHGYILAKEDNELIHAFTTGPTWKSFSVVNGATPYLTWISRAKEYAGERASPGYLCWLEDVDTEVQTLSDVSVFDLPDVCLRDWYEDDYSRPDAARMALGRLDYPL